MSQSYEARLRALETEMEISHRRRSEECDKALTILNKITPENIELLKTIVPEISELNKITKDILMNDDSVYDTILLIINKLSKYLDDQLSMYERNI